MAAAATAATRWAMSELLDVVRKAARKADATKALAAVAENHPASVLLPLLAGTQDGQFATRQARALGLSQHAIAWLAERGTVIRIRPGVYRYAGATGIPDAAVTAWLVFWPHGTISHDSAAHVHGFGDPPATAHVTVPHASRRGTTGITIHRTRGLPNKDRVWLDGVAYTSIARTVCDLADPNDAMGSLTRVDDAVAGGAKRLWIHRRASELACGRAGVVLVRDATAPGASDEFRSWLERTCGGVYEAAGLPRPAWNERVRDRRGLIGVVDSLWRTKDTGAQRDVIAECEGLRFHTTPSQRRRDAERFNRLLAAGHVVRRFTWRDVVERPDYLAHTVADALREAGADVDDVAIPPERALVVPWAAADARWGG